MLREQDEEEIPELQKLQLKISLKKFEDFYNLDLDRPLTDMAWEGN